MGKPYSDDLRERVVAAIEAGHTRVEVAELYSESTIDSAFSSNALVAPFNKFTNHANWQLTIPTHASNSGIFTLQSE
jgi:hypothetical protein